MGSLSDLIEQYLRRMLEAGGRDALEVQRCELARIFRCAPSQINYVLDTRFSPDRGFVVESRRGGGGYIRIQRMQGGFEIWSTIEHRVGLRIDSRTADVLLLNLYENGVIEERTLPVIRLAVSREVNQAGTGEEDFIRARVLRAILGVLLDQREK